MGSLEGLTVEEESRAMLLYGERFVQASERCRVWAATCNSLSGQSAFARVTALWAEAFAFSRALIGEEGHFPSTARAFASRTASISAWLAEGIRWEKDDPRSLDRMVAERADSVLGGLAFGVLAQLAAPGWDEDRARSLGSSSRFLAMRNFWGTDRDLNFETSVRRSAREAREARVVAPLPMADLFWRWKP